VDLPSSNNEHNSRPPIGRRENTLEFDNTSCDHIPNQLGKPQVVQYRHNVADDAPRFGDPNAEQGMGHAR
jgi:hypothetical protein